MDIKIVKNPNPAQKPAEDNLGFGKIFTDHMFMMDYTIGEGWHDARIVPFGPIAMHPAANVLHYASEIFEGMKAYRRADGQVQLFRPIENVRRMNNSALRMAMPTIPEEDMMQAFTTFVGVDQDWVPHAPGTSLYLRPFMFSTEPTLGLHESRSVEFVIIASPSGSYYKEGINPVKIMIEEDDVRAVRGGTGYAKCGGNYAASLRATVKADKMGYTQSLWLDGVERKYIEEVGSMNVMFKINGVVVTPKLTGSVLPGITRKSSIQLMQEMGLTVEERLFSVDELVAACKAGTLEEAWGTGTAAVVSPIGQICYHGETYTFNGGKIGPVTQKLYDTLTGIQWGTKEDTHGWIVEIPKK